MRAASTTAISAHGPTSSTEQCTYKITTADNHSQGLEAGVVFANSRAMLLDRVTSLREANVYERHTYRHFLGQPWIQSQDGGQRAQRDVLLRGAHHARRHDRHLSRRAAISTSIRLQAEGAPKLVERIVVCDSSRFDTLLALPL